MPQLDKVTFLSQFAWLCFFFFGFYLSLVKHFLPRMSRLLKLRQRKMNVSQEGSSMRLQEKETVHQNCDNLVLEGVKVSRSYFSTACQSTSDWVSSIVETTNQTSFKPLNKSYLQSLHQAVKKHGLLEVDIQTLSCPGSPSYLQDGSCLISGLKQEALYTRLVVRRLHRQGGQKQAILFPELKDPSPVRADKTSKSPKPKKTSSKKKS
jgi:hypothetical protein